MKHKLDVSFYHFTATPLAVGLPRLIKKIYDTGKNLFVLCKSEEEMLELDKSIWTFSSKEFIPHGRSGETHDSLQPVLLSLDPQANRNGSDVLLTTCGAQEALSALFKRCVYTFYGNADEVQEMTDLHRSYQTRGDVASVFWQQARDGKWSNTNA